MRTSHSAARLLGLSFAAVTLLAGCETKRERARADSLQAITDRQLALTTALSSQKDSLMRAIFESDSLLTRIDSQIRSVKGLSTKKRVTRNYESPLEEQLVRRKELSDRVEALVQRTRATAGELAESRKREQELRGKNDTLQLRIEDDQRIIAELGAKVQEQAATIASLELRVDSLITETKVIGERYYRAYYVVGTEDELVEKGIVEREGGANLLFARIGRTLQPARGLDPELFTAIDRRDVLEIPLPDSTKRYAVVSRQSLDNAQVAERDKAEFRGHLRIPDAERDYFLERQYPAFGNLVPRDVASRNAKEVCDEGRGVGDSGLAVYLDFADAIRRLGVETEEREDAIVFRLHVAPDDVGKVIGRQGRMARALRSIVRAGGARADERYILEIAD